ncbi:phage major capsid protein [Campylobacter sputorum]|uniref:phage major capsid protein n=1 Tax=Campylobacter sputorum TaxID=206 RepID=UPI00053C0589|nr:phage major capsid protein [Campylobacter sputorum]
MRIKKEQIQSANFEATLQKNNAFNDDELTIGFIALSKDNLHKRSFFGDEYYLSVDTKGVKFSAKTLYKDHRPSFDSAIGKIEEVKFEDGNYKVKVKFDKDIKESFEAYNKYKAGLSSSVSVGFGEIKLKEMDDIDGLPHFQIYDGVVEELSAVWQGADPNAKVSKFNKQKGENMPKEILEKVEIEKPKELAKETSADEVAKFEAKAKLEAEERKDIIELAKVLGKEAEGLKAIENGLSYKEFSKELAKLNQSEKYETLSYQTSSKKELNNAFSLARILANSLNPNVKLGIEADFVGKNGGFMLPDEFISHFADTLTTTTTAKGAVNQIYRGDLLIEQLKQDSEFLSKVHFLSDLNGTVTIPRDNSNITADFVEEGASRDAEPLSFDYITLSPHTLTSAVTITRTMLNMGFMSLDSYAYTLIKEAIRKKLEFALLYGDGVVKGLFNTAGIPAIEGYLGAPTLETTLAFGGKLDDANVDTNKAVFFFKGSDISLLKSTPRGKSLDVHLIENGNDLQGYPALKNNQLKAKECVFGDFSNLLVGAFGGLEIKPLPIAGGNIKLEGFYDIDAKVKREKAFVVSKPTA